MPGLEDQINKKKKQTQKKIIIMNKCLESCLDINKNKTNNKNKNQMKIPQFCQPPFFGNE